MLKYILMILGGVIFIAGYYFMQQNEGRGKTMMFYSLFTYAGLTLVILSGARVLDPFFEGLGKNGEMIHRSRSCLLCNWCGIASEACIRRPERDRNKEEYYTTWIRRFIQCEGK